MTKKELNRNITYTFEALVEKLFNAYDFDESDGGRRTFHIESDRAERGYIGFEWSRTGHDICSWDSMKWVNPTDEQTSFRNFVLDLEEKIQALMDDVVTGETEKYNLEKVAN